MMNHSWRNNWVIMWNSDTQSILGVQSNGCRKNGLIRGNSIQQLLIAHVLTRAFSWVYASEQQLLNVITFDLSIWQAGSSWHYLGGLMVKVMCQTFKVIWEFTGGKSFLVMHAHYKARKGMVDYNCIWFEFATVSDNRVQFKGFQDLT